jgi:hypothetical protein
MRQEGSMTGKQSVCFEELGPGKKQVNKLNFKAVIG